MEIAATRVRYGYRRIHVLLRREGWRVNHKRVHRLYREMGLQLRHKTPKRRVKAKLREDRRPATRTNETWAMDFVHDQLATATKLRVLTIVGTFSRFSQRSSRVLASAAPCVIEVLERVGREVGFPLAIQVDQGSEFVSRDLDLWAYQRGVTLDFSRPGKPTDKPACLPSSSGFLPEVWIPNEEAEALRRPIAERHQIVSHMTRLKNRVHSVLHANLIPRCAGKLFSERGRTWLYTQPLPEDQRRRIGRHLDEHDRIAIELVALEKNLAENALRDDRVKRMMTIGGVNAIVALGVLAAIGDVARFSSPQKLVSYFGLNPKVRQSGDRPGLSRSHQQAGPRPRARYAGRGGMVNRDPARAAASILQPRQRATRPADRRCRDRSQAGGSDLALTHE
jgi:Transposase IS116/IS110/IS902 family/HTH-like domain/Integrase core domain